MEADLDAEHQLVNMMPSLNDAFVRARSRSWG